MKIWRKKFRDKNTIKIENVIQKRKNGGKGKNRGNWGKWEIPLTTNH